MMPLFKQREKVIWNTLARKENRERGNKVINRKAKRHKINYIRNNFFTCALRNVWPKNFTNSEQNEQFIYLLIYPVFPTLHQLFHTSTKIILPGKRKSSFFFLLSKSHLGYCVSQIIWLVDVIKCQHLFSHLMLNFQNYGLAPPICKYESEAINL